MRTFDFTPLYRSSVGFDRFADLFSKFAANDVTAGSYPPFNIARLDNDSYRISIAVAGLADKDLKVEVHQNQLVISAKKADEENGIAYLHRGIAERGFVRKFWLADHIVVTGADYENGMLHIDLKREIPEALKPRRIEIGSASEKAAKPVAIEA